MKSFLEEKILRIVAKEPTCNSKLAEMLGVPYRTIQRTTLKLSEQRQITRTGRYLIPAFWTICKQEEVGRKKK